MLGAFTTSFYMFRLIYKTFHGEPRNHEIHAHESPKVMLVPLVILATLAIVAGFVGTPFKNLFEHSMAPVLGEHFEGMLEHAMHGFAPGFNMTVFLIATLAALAGIGLATIIWLKPILKIEKLEPAFGWLAKIVENKYYIDEIYNATIIRALMIAAAVMYWFDKWVIDYADSQRCRLPDAGRVGGMGLVRQDDRGRAREPGGMDHRVRGTQYQTFADRGRAAVCVPAGGGGHSY